MHEQAVEFVSDKRRAGTGTNEEKRIFKQDRPHHSVGRMAGADQTALLQRRARKQALRSGTDAEDISSQNEANDISESMGGCYVNK